jgi:ketosteroid isomerase-like protein
MTPIEAAHAFADAINARNVEALFALMSDDHVFVDSLGHRIEGREKMKTGWAGYYLMVPDYSITVEETFATGDTVVLLGTAQGTYAKSGEMRPENWWKIPAAWRAQIRGSLVAEWRVYADNDPMRRLMAKGG